MGGDGHVVPRAALSTAVLLVHAFCVRCPRHSTYSRKRVEVIERVKCGDGKMCRESLTQTQHSIPPDVRHSSTNDIAAESAPEMATRVRFYLPNNAPLPSLR